MELWIRSQSKEILQKTNALFIAHSEENIWSIIDNQNMTKYGIYKTKERALEVLDEISNILMPPIALYMNKGVTKETMNDVINNGVVCVRDNGEVKQLYETYVYQMPEE